MPGSNSMDIMDIKGAKIFISYSRSDHEIAVRIANALKKAQFEVWLDIDRIQPGQNWVRVIDQALTDAGYLIALLSKASLESLWVQQEWTTVLTRQLSGTNGGVVIPLRLEPISLPTILRAMQAIDLFPDFDEGLKKLVGFLLCDTRPAWLVQHEFHATRQIDNLADSLSLQTLKTEPARYSNATWNAWHQALHSERVTDPALAKLDNRTIRRIALRCLSQAELQSFCFDNGIQPGSVGGNSLNEQILSLLQQLLRDGILEQFIKWLAEESPRCVENAIKIFMPTPPS